MQFVSLGSLWDSGEVQPSWIVRGLVMDAAVVAVAGEPKTTKTWGCLDMLLSVASGTRAFGRFETGKPRTVAAFLAEDHAASAKTRLGALCAGKQLAAAAVRERVHLICRGRLDVTDPGQRAELVEALLSLPERPALVALDPLVNVARMEDENSSRCVTEAMNGLRAVRDEVGCSVLFVHHMTKGGASSNARRAGQNMRGSSAIHGAVDGGIYLTNLQGDLRSTFEVDVGVEVKAARAADPFKLCLTVEDDADGYAKRATWTVDGKTSKRAA